MYVCLGVIGVIFFLSLKSRNKKKKTKKYFKYVLGIKKFQFLKGEGHPHRKQGVLNEQYGIGLREKE